MSTYVNYHFVARLIKSSLTFCLSAVS